MSLWDNNILLGKQVWDAFLGNNVLNLQTWEFRKRSPLPNPHHNSWIWSVSCACFHHSSAFSSPYRALLSPLLPALPTGQSPIRGPYSLTWLSAVTKCCTVCPSAVVISWMYAASSCNVSKCTVWSGRLGLTTAPQEAPTVRSGHTGLKLKARDPTHLAGDTLLLCNKDVLLPQSLLQPLRSQHGLASLQSRCNTEREPVGMLLGTLPGLPIALLPSGHCVTPASEKSTGQSHTR